MDRKIRVAAIGDNCIDYYDSLNESYPGGNPVNVAVYIKRLGGESSYIGAVGTDSFGKIMISAIQNKGVDTSHIQVLDGKTAVTHVDIVDGDRVFGKYEEGVLADFKLREQDISFIKKHDLAVTGIWGMIEDELPLISKEIPVAFDFANKFANPIVEKAIPYVTYAFFSFDEESRNEFRQKYHSMGLKEKENCTEQLKEFMKAMQQKGPSVLYFQWRKSRGSSEKFHGAVVDHDASEKNRVFQEVAWIGKDLEKLSSQILSTCNRAKVAIIMDWENWWALSDAQAISRKFDYTEELLKYYRVFWEKGIEVDIISMDRELLDYQLVVAPTLYLHKKEYIHKVEAYVEAGGIYVTTYWSGVVNETDLCFIGERPHERLLGLSVDEIDVGNEYFPNTFSYKDGVYKAGVLREVVTLQTAKPLGTYLQDYNVNTPAITENAYGKGKAYYVVVQPDLEFLKEFLGDVIEEANVEANLTETLPYGVTVSKRSGKEQKDDVYFLQNFNRHPVKMVLNECYTNLITDEILTGSIKLQTYQCIVMKKK